MNKIRNILYFIIICICYNIRVFAGCSHCYQCAKVIIEWKNSKTDSGYIPIFNFSYEFWRRYKKENTINTNILPLLKLDKTVKPIQFSKRFYKFGIPEIPPVAAKESTIIISPDSLKSIKLLGWNKEVNGSSGFSLLPLKEINKILKDGIKEYFRMDMNVADLIFMNTNVNIDENHFQCLTNYFNNLGSGYGIGRLNSRIKNPESAKYYESKLPPGDIVEQSILEAIQIINEDIEKPDSPCSSPIIDQYFFEVTKKYRKVIEIYDSFYSLIAKNDNLMIMKIVNSIPLDSLKKEEIINIINNIDDSNKGNSIIKLNKAFEEWLQIFRGDVYLKVINSFGIITFEYGWD